MRMRKDITAMKQKLNDLRQSRESNREETGEFKILTVEVKEGKGLTLEGKDAVKPFFYYEFYTFEHRSETVQNTAQLCKFGDVKRFEIASNS